MDFLKIFDKKAEEKNWLNFLLSLLDFLCNEELKWIPNADDKIGETYSAFIALKDVNGEPKIIISIIRSSNTHCKCTINVEYKEDVSAMFMLMETKGNQTELFGFYKHHNGMKTVIVGEENELVKSKFKDLHHKLIHLRLSSKI